jgi:hypothetical protein
MLNICINHSILTVPLFFKQGSSTLHYNLGEAEAPGFIPGGSFFSKFSS